MGCVVMTEDIQRGKSSNDNALCRRDAKKDEEGRFVSKNTLEYK